MKTKNKRKHKRDAGVWEILIALFLVLALMGIGAPILIQKLRTAHTEQSTFINDVVNQNKTIKSYSDFWSYYKVIMKDRADTDGNHNISLDEIKTFQEQFFGNLNLIVDPATKVITKKDGTLANSDALICQLKTFYVNKGYIKPICPDL